MSRKVSVHVFQYPEDANRTLSLRRFMEIKEQLIWHDKFYSSQDLRDLMSLYRLKVSEYSTLIGEPYVYRIVIRDSITRLIASFRI